MSLLPPPPPPPSSRGPSKKRKFGSGEIPLKDLPYVKEQFSGIVERLDDLQTVQQGKFKDVEEIEVIKVQVQQMLDSIDKYADLCTSEAKKNNLDVKSISFSKFDDELMRTRLGVSVRDIPCQSVKDLGDRLISALELDTSSRQLPEIVTTVEQSKFDSLERLLVLISSSVNIRSEASGRMCIDQWLLESINLTSALPHEAHYQSILIPECQISKLGDKPARIEYGKYVTFITGSTDHALWCIPNHGYDHQHEAAIYKYNDIMTITILTPSETLVFYEAKREAEDLLEHVPQVVAQCLATCAMKTDLLHVPFCLTTGKEWMFGLVDTSVTPNTCWKTAVFNIPGSPSPDIIKVVMTLILLWTVQPASALRDAVQKL